MRRKISLGVLVVLLVTFVGVFWQRQLVKDQLVVWSATQQQEAIDLGKQIQLTDEGTFMLKASRSQVQNADEFNQSCRGAMAEHSIVLGCYTRQRIFVFNVADERLDGVQQVTTAHEVLHAAYDRLTNNEKEALNKELVATAETIQDQRFKDTVAEYKRLTPDHLENELHSILGTEIAVLPDSLEQHYKRYFVDRSVVVSYSKRYEAAFTQVQSQIADYDAQLTALNERKTQLEQSLATQQAAIEQERRRLSQLRTSDTQSYNQAVPGFNATIQAYNDDIALLRRLVRDYNEIVQRRNALAATQNDLVKQLDSTYKTIE